MGLIENEFKNYATIISDGSIRIKSEESDPKSVLRRYELSDGTKGEKWELVYGALEGLINDIQIYDNKWGKTLQITVDEITLSINMSSSFAIDILKKLPNVDLTQKVKFTPYSFKGNNGKLQKGVTVTQENKKILNFFFDVDKKESINGHPAFPENYKDFDKDDWKTYFIQISKFLQKYLLENIIPKIPKIERKAELTPAQNEENSMQDGEINVEDIPFKDDEFAKPATTPTTPATPVQSTANIGVDLEAVKTQIADLAKAKLGVTNDNDVQRVVMESTGLAWIQSNLNSILEKLKAM